MKFYRKCLLLDPFKGFYFNSPQLQRSKTASLLLEKEYCDEDFCQVIQFCSCKLIAAPQGSLTASHVWEIVCRQNLTIFKGCHYSRFYITISLSFQKIETKNLNSDPCILIFLVLGTNHQLHISYLNIKSDPDIEAATRWYS